MIKLIAMDFDNTLVTHGGREPFVEPELLEYLGAYIRAGNYAGIVSGRPVHEMEVLFGAMGLEWCAPFPNLVISRESYIFLTEADGALTSWEQFNRPARRRVGEKLFRLGQFVGAWHSCLEEEGLEVEKWNLYGDFSLEYGMANQEMAQQAIGVLQGLLKAENLEGYHIHRNGSLATVIDAEAGKGNVLDAARFHLSLAPNEVLALGDSLNDATMLDGHKGFVSGCVGNSAPPLTELVRAAGGLQGRGVAGAGVLDVIRRLEKAGHLPRF